MGSIGMMEGGMLEVDKAKVSLECGKAEECAEASKILSEEFEFCFV